MEWRQSADTSESCREPGTTSDADFHTFTTIVHAGLPCGAVVCAVQQELTILLPLCNDAEMVR